MAAPTTREDDQRPWLSWIGPVASLLTGLWITAPAWGARAISGDDAMALVIRADRGIELARQLQVDGWSPDFLLGYQQFLFYGPGFSWAVALVRAFTFGTVETPAALTLVAVVATIALGPATIFLARSLGLDRVAAGVAGVLVLMVDNVFGLGATGTFGIALVPHQMAGVAFCLALGAAARTTLDPRRRWVVMLGISLSVLVVTHLFSTASLALLLPITLVCLLFTDRPPAAAIVRLAAGGALGALLSAFWLLPYVAHWDDRGVVPGWSVPPIGQRIVEIVDARVLFGPYRGWLVAAGLAWALVQAARRRRWALVPPATAAAFLICAHTLASRAPGFELSPHLANRTLGYAGLLAILGLAALISEVTGLLVERRQAAAVVATAAAVLIVLALPDSPRRVVGRQPVPIVALREAADVIARAVPDGARFATERDFPGEIDRLGLSHPDFWIAAAARRPTLNVFGLELSPSPQVSSIPESVRDQVASGPDGIANLATALATNGTTHLVTVSVATADELIGPGAAAHFQTLYRRGPVAVFEVLPEPGSLPPSSLVASAPPGTAVTRRSPAPGRHLFSIDAPAGGLVDLAIGWSSRWQATLRGGIPVPVSRSTAGTITVSLPAGRSSLDLAYGPDPWRTAGVGVSMLTAAGIIGWAMRRLLAIRRVRLDHPAPQVWRPAPADEPDESDETSGA